MAPHTLISTTHRAHSFPLYLSKPFSLPSPFQTTLYARRHRNHVMDIVSPSPPFRQYKTLYTAAATTTGRALCARTIYIYMRLCCASESYISIYFRRSIFTFSLTRRRQRQRTILWTVMIVCNVPQKRQPTGRPFLYYHLSPSSFSSYLDL